MSGKPAKFLNLGDRFGKRVVISDEFVMTSGGKHYRVRCDCGHVGLAKMSKLTHGLSQRCNKCVGKKNQTHGLSQTRAYNSWRSMISRCEDKSRKNYHRYGGRGIKVCDRWLDPVAFINDMGQPPKGYTLDRVDTNGMYEPSNCRWASHAEQHQNKSTTKLNPESVKAIRAASISGASNSSIARVYGVNPSTIREVILFQIWSNV